MSMLAAAGIMAGASLLGGYLNARGVQSANSTNVAWERERAQNAHQWEVQDLQKAGLNPILSAGGTGAVTGSINAQNPNEGYANAINNTVTNAIALKQMKIDLQRQKADIRNQTALTNAQVAQANANTARTLALTPEEIETHRFNRSGRLNRELGTTASAKAQEMIGNIVTYAGEKYGKATTHTQQPKPKSQWKPATLIFRDNKHTYIR